MDTYISQYMYSKNSGKKGYKCCDKERRKKNQRYRMFCLSVNGSLSVRNNNFFFKCGRRKRRKNNNNNFLFQVLAFCYCNYDFYSFIYLLLKLQFFSPRADSFFFLCVYSTLIISCSLMWNVYKSELKVDFFSFHTFFFIYTNLLWKYHYFTSIDCIESGFLCDILLFGWNSLHQFKERDTFVIIFVTIISILFLFLLFPLNDIIFFVLFLYFTLSFLILYPTFYYRIDADREIFVLSYLNGVSWKIWSINIFLCLLERIMIADNYEEIYI